MTLFKISYFLSSFIFQYPDSSIQRLRTGKAFSSIAPDIPQTSFNCQDQQYPGLYADPEADCQVPES